MPQELFSRPHHFVRRLDFLWIWGLYTATYVAANTIDTVCQATEVNPSIPKFLGTTAVWFCDRECCIHGSLLCHNRIALDAG